MIQGERNQRNSARKQPRRADTYCLAFGSNALKIENTTLIQSEEKMVKTLLIALLVTISFVFSGCGDDTQTNTALVGNARLLVPIIASSSRAQRDDPLTLSAVHSVPVYIFGSYLGVEALDPGGGVASYNLDGLLSNAAAIIDALPLSESGATSFDAEWQGKVFPVVLGANQNATAAATSPFTFGATSAAPAGNYSTLKKGTCSNQSLGYNANIGGAWLISGTAFYMLYAESATNTRASSSKYVIQGSYDSSTGTLIYNQANHSVSTRETIRTRSEILGNTGTKLTSIRIMILQGANLISLAGKGTVGSGDMMLKVQAGGVTKWLCFSSAATMADFQAAVLNSSDDGSYAGGKIQVYTSASSFSGSCASNPYITELASSTLFDGTSAPDDASLYYSTLE